ncbi:hypothetical protein INT47_008602 [Mucor saturninus]|uniref:Peptidase A2 domain-containing protein n=1 Tax=Mucor saturninus TaxID=64648 RepID=A0A8H7UUV9_9FUNG|nr:hypothetical protein INT47_008602 [Mucor saturninus]
MDTYAYNAPGPSTLLTQPYQPIAPKAPTLTNTAINLPTRENIIYDIDNDGNIARRKITPLSERISYDITEDILNRKADINVKDLLIAAPSLKKDLAKSVGEKTKKARPLPLTLAFAEDDDVDTTAIYTEVRIGQFKIKAISDTGSAKTVMSKKLADILELNIDTPANSVFTLGNGARQPALGLIYDVPINLGGKLIVPGSIEVLP